MPSIGIAVSVSFTPHARGSTIPIVHVRTDIEVYPACAGIDLSAPVPVPKSSSLPRMRGDRPPPHHPAANRQEFTPHARGSTLLADLAELTLEVYPACAGIDRSSIITHLQHCGLPRMRGDRPEAAALAELTLEFTPHARGSTHTTKS